MIQKNQQKAPYPYPDVFPTFFPSLSESKYFSAAGSLGLTASYSCVNTNEWSCISDENPRNYKKANFYSLVGFHVASA